jgi:hypothetical protein
VAQVSTINDLLDGHVALDLECLDRIYLNAYVPTLQTHGQVVGFLVHHRQQPIVSPAAFAQIGDAFRKAVAAFAKRRGIPLIAKDTRKIEAIEPYFEATKQPGVVAIGVAQELQSVFAAYDRSAKEGAPRFAGAPRYAFVREDRRVTAYYFYIADPDFGLGFIKLCAYFPYPGTV